MSHINKLNMTMKRITHYLASIIVGIALFSCDNYYESNVTEKSVTFMVGIDKDTPYASEIILSSDVAVNNSAAIISNQTWTIEGNDDSNAFWCGLFTDESCETRLTSGENSCTFHFKIERNPDVKDRAAMFEFILSPSGARRSLKIIQRQEPIQITAARMSITLSSNAVSEQVAMYSNVPVEFIVVPADAASWLSVVTSNNLVGNFNMEFALQENTSDTKREAQIIARNTEYNVADTIYINQMAPMIEIVFTDNFTAEGNFAQPATMSNVISWTNDVCPNMTTQIIEVRSAVTEELWDKIECDAMQALATFNLSAWITVPENRIKYGEQLTEMIVNVQLYVEGDMMANGAIRVNPYFPVGKGTLAEPHEIYNLGQLNSVRLWLGGNYLLKQNIDLSASVNGVSDVVNEKYFTGAANILPIGVCGLVGTEDDKPFSGTFDGGGKVIANLKMNSTVDDDKPYGIGLFGAMSGTSSTQRASIKNLTVTGEINAAGRRFVAGIVGKINNYADMDNCVNMVDVSVKRETAASYYFSSSVGGVVGQAGNLDANNVKPVDNNLQRISNKADVTISNCVNRGNVTVEQGLIAFGGVAGGGTGSFVRCANVGTVVVSVVNSSSGHRVGGIVGYFCGTEIKECFNAGVIDGGWAHIGGIVGAIIPANDVTQDSGARIADCYNAGTINYSSQGATRPAGIVGNLNSYAIYSISNCYNAGTINILAPSSATGSGITGINGSIESTSGCVVLAGSADVLNYPAPVDENNVKSATQEEMSMSGTFTGWDFNNVWAMGSTAPYLKHNNHLIE